jgi:hypothetical protein
MKIALLLIATRKYKQFVQPLLEDVKKYFLTGHQVEVHLFTDDLQPEYTGDERVSVKKHIIPPYGFPQATLYRYKIFTSRYYEGCDYLFYIDVDMSIVAPVGDEILHELVVILHPGFACVGGGAWCTNEKSTAFIPPELRKLYFAGGFQGGRITFYYAAMMVMRDNIELDEKNNAIPEWHDESHWNSFVVVFNEKLKDHGNLVVLDSSYCMVEQQHLREKWKIDHLEPKIIALEKKHEEIRN